MNKYIMTLLLAGLFCGVGALAAGKSSQPNFIVIFVDNMGYGDLGCFGSPKIKTPNLDQMAREGMRFTNFYAQTVCGPSRAALMTGCYPLRVAIEENRVETCMEMLSRKSTGMSGGSWKP